MTQSRLHNKYLEEKNAHSKIAMSKEITVQISNLGPKIIILLTSTSAQYVTISFGNCFSQIKTLVK